MDINFLKNSLEYQGSEYLKFQNKTAYNKLVQLFDTYLSNTNKLDEAITPLLVKAVEEISGLNNTIVNVVDYGNLGVDVGFISPNNVLNRDLGPYLSPRETNLYKWFNENKSNFIKGGCDMTTGKVFGDLRKIPLLFYINLKVSDYLTVKEANKVGLTVPECLAVFTLHELGHIFFGLASITEGMYDNMILAQTIHALHNNSDEKVRMTIWRTAAEALEVRGSDVDKDYLGKVSQRNDEVEWVLCFNDLVSRRNAWRTRSLGLEALSFEALSDLYAIRMGASVKSVGALIAIIKTNTSYIHYLKVTMRQHIRFILYHALRSVFNMVFFGVAALGIVTGLLLFYISNFIMFKTMNFIQSLVSGTYNSFYRRINDSLKQSIQEIKANQTAGNDAKQELINQAYEASKDVEKFKPFFEGTALQGILMFLAKGSNYRYDELEHYTQQIADSNINIANAKLNLL